MNLQNIPFNRHREVWESEAFIMHIFGIKDRNKVFTDKRVLRYLNQLDGIPITQHYTLIGYGSLMNEDDVTRTIKTGFNHRLGLVKNYERVFNIGQETAYLNIRECKGQEIEVALIDFEFTDIPNIIRRESLYGFKTIKTYDPSIGKEIEALAVIGLTGYENNIIEPQLNYLHLCLTGAKELNEIYGINNFLDSSYCYSPTHANIVSVRKYLQELNVINHMIQNDYSSR